MKKILVITATLGNRDTLTRTIESVRTVGGDLVHHVIVSPAAAIPAIQEKYGGIDCLAELPGKKGIYAALNHGFQTYGRDYDYLTFINDDDYWLPAYRVLIDAMMNDESLDLAYGRTRYVNENNEYLGSQTSSPRFKDFTGLVKAKNIILLTQQATLIKSRWYFELGGFDESLRLVADSKFWMQLSQKPIRYKYFNRECAAYMIQDGQLSSDHTLQAKEHERLFTEFSNVPPERNPAKRTFCKPLCSDSSLSRFSYSLSPPPMMSSSAFRASSPKAAKARMSPSTFLRGERRPRYPRRNTLSSFVDG